MCRRIATQIVTLTLVLMAFARLCLIAMALFATPAAEAPTALTVEPTPASAPRQHEPQPASGRLSARSRAIATVDGFEPLNFVEPAPGPVLDLQSPGK